MAAESDPNQAQGATTLVSVLDRAAADGFDAQFVVEPSAVDGPAIRCGACGTVSPAASFDRRWRWRLEGASDPDDLLDVSALRCPACEAGGTLVTSFGQKSSIEEADVARALPAPTGEPPVTA